MAYMRLGDLLITAGAITPEQLDRALELQKSSTPSMRIRTTISSS